MNGCPVDGLFGKCGNAWMRRILGFLVLLAGCVQPQQSQGSATVIQTLCGAPPSSSQLLQRGDTQTFELSDQVPLAGGDVFFQFQACAPQGATVPFNATFDVDGAQAVVPVTQDAGSQFPGCSTGAGLWVTQEAWLTVPAAPTGQGRHRVTVSASGGPFRAAVLPLLYRH